MYFRSAIPESKLKPARHRRLSFELAFRPSRQEGTMKTSRLREVFVAIRRVPCCRDIPAVRWLPSRKANKERHHLLTSSCRVCARQDGGGMSKTWPSNTRNVQDLFVTETWSTHGEEVEGDCGLADDVRQRREGGDKQLTHSAEGHSANDGNCPIVHPPVSPSWGARVSNSTRVGYHLEDEQTSVHSATCSLPSALEGAARRTAEAPRSIYRGRVDLTNGRRPSALSKEELEELWNRGGDDTNQARCGGPVGPTIKPTLIYGNKSPMATSPRQIRCACNGRKLPDVLDRPGVIDGFDKTVFSCTTGHGSPAPVQRLSTSLPPASAEKNLNYPDGFGIQDAWGYKRRETRARVDWVSRGTITSYEDEEKQEGSHSTTTTAASIACQPNEHQPYSRACFPETSVTNDQMEKVRIDEEEEQERAWKIGQKRPAAKGSGGGRRREGDSSGAEKRERKPGEQVAPNVLTVRLESLWISSNHQQGEGWIGLREWHSHPFAILPQGEVTPTNSAAGPSLSQLLRGSWVTMLARGRRRRFQRVWQQSLVLGTIPSGLSNTSTTIATPGPPPAAFSSRCYKATRKLSLPSSESLKEARKWIFHPAALAYSRIEHERQAMVCAFIDARLPSTISYLSIVKTSSGQTACTRCCSFPSDHDMFMELRNRPSDLLVSRDGNHSSGQRLRYQNIHDSRMPCRRKDIVPIGRRQSSTSWTEGEHSM
ncbi:hypothetical protein BKA70DRAFT_1413471 [Coprinopsis sp. MPI-PUGE-AT-0042]|nr:hypothetical protein BKA70DRAFT_1413471 [Coprinopsis sp. MPI-PUGE-AT-0042]